VKLSLESATAAAEGHPPKKPARSEDAGHTYCKEAAA